MQITCMHKEFVKTLKVIYKFSDTNHGIHLNVSFQIGEYHDLYLKTYILLLDDVFENFRKKYLKIYHLDPAKFLSDP